MNRKDREHSDSKQVPFGSAVILFLVGIIGKISGLFRVKGRVSNASGEEQKAFSDVLDAMKNDLDQKDRS